MKTAISIPTQVFQAAERLAKRLGVSRSRLYTKAITAYLERHREEETTAALNHVYGGDPEESQLPEYLRRMQGASILRERW